MKVITVSRCSAVFPEPRWGADNQALEVALQMSDAAESHFVYRGELSEASRRKLKSVIVKSKMNIESHVRSLYFLKGFLLSLLGGFGALKRINSDGPFDIAISFSSVTTLLISKLNNRQRIIHVVQDELVRVGDSRISYFISLIERIIRLMLNNFLESRAVKAADGVVPVSPHILEQLTSMVLDPVKVRVLLPALRTEFIRCASAIRSGVTFTNLEIDGFEYTDYIISVGNMDGRKRFDLLILSLLQVDTLTHLVLVGNGPKLHEYKQLVKRLNLMNRVHFFSEISEESLVTLYYKSRFVALVSEREAFPTIAIEALYLGKDFLFINHSSELLQDTFDGTDDLYHPSTCLDIESISRAINGVTESLRERTIDNNGIGPLLMGGKNIKSDIKSLVLDMVPIALGKSIAIK